MAEVSLSDKGAVQLPADVLRSLHLRKGSKVEVVVSGDVVLLVPASRIRKDQRYFYTQEWQQREAEADGALSRGDFLGPFDDADDAIAALRSDKV